jgi:hypothetical protein
VTLTARQALYESFEELYPSARGRRLIAGYEGEDLTVRWLAFLGGAAWALSNVEECQGGAAEIHAMLEQLLNGPGSTH